MYYIIINLTNYNKTIRIKLYLFYIIILIFKKIHQCVIDDFDYLRNFLIVPENNKIPY